MTTKIEALARYHSAVADELIPSLRPTHFKMVYIWNDLFRLEPKPLGYQFSPAEVSRIRDEYHRQIDDLLTDGESVGGCTISCRKYHQPAPDGEYSRHRMFAYDIVQRAAGDATALVFWVDRGTGEEILFKQIGP